MTDYRNSTVAGDIPVEKFRFVSKEQCKKAEPTLSKRKSYLSDSTRHFYKNRSSVAAALLMVLLCLFAVTAPIISPYTMSDKDPMYTGLPAFVPSASGIFRVFFDGSVTRDSQNDQSILRLKAIGEETGRNPLISIEDTKVSTVIYRGESKERTTYTLKKNAYYEIGVVYRVFSYEEFSHIQEWQNSTGIQVFFPYTQTDSDDSNVWYKTDSERKIITDENGDFIHCYSTDSEKAGAPYDSLRIHGDDGSFVYSLEKSGAVKCRVDYYNYYIYQNGHEPMYILGTNGTGMDLFCALGMGTGFSLLFATVVSFFNIMAGIMVGSVQGYYGGMTDMLIDRGIDILSGVPFMIVATLFQLYFAEKAGIVPAFILAFMLTGWIGTANVVRKQFYRYKGRDFVLAARTLGVNDRGLMFRHIFPNAIGTVITSSALVAPGIIYMETNLTYLGIVDLNKAGLTSLGTLMSEGQADMVSAPHTVLWPTFLIALIMIAFNLLANGLRDAFNPVSEGNVK